MFRLTNLIILSALLMVCTSLTGSENDKKGSWQKFKQEAKTLGKPEWRPMLNYVAELHQKSTHPATWPFKYDWEEIGPGYVYGTAFGHWDLIHQVLDVMPSYGEHAYHQLLNNIENQEPNGLIPGSIWMTGGKSGRTQVGWNNNSQGHPPLWVIAVQDYADAVKHDSIIKQFYPALVRQISWFENKRKAEGTGEYFTGFRKEKLPNGEGFFYNDILTKKWESGVDEGVRFDDVDKGAFACIDATAHVYLLYKYAHQWSKQLGLEYTHFAKREQTLQRFMLDSLWSEPDKMFYDSWSMKKPAKRHIVYENFFPLIVGAISKAQADYLIDNYLLNPKHFYTKHPVATVSASDPKFELRMWRGPAWNSMSYWVARACMDYNRPDAAIKILEPALDETAKQFARTGTIWEFYHPHGGKPEDVTRKPFNQQYQPCKDYLGHNPVFAMARMYEQAKRQVKR